VPGTLLLLQQLSVFNPKSKKKKKKRKKKKEKKKKKKNEMNGSHLFQTCTLFLKTKCIKSYLKETGND
jgi:hypothetical protein